MFSDKGLVSLTGERENIQNRNCKNRERKNRKRNRNVQMKRDLQKEVVHAECKYLQINNFEIYLKTEIN